MPSPLYPALHVHVYDPCVLTQSAFMSQESLPSSHSSASGSVIIVVSYTASDHTYVRTYVRPLPTPPPHTHTHSQTRTHASTHARTHSHARTHTDTHARTHARTLARTHTHTHTHTHVYFNTKNDREFSLRQNPKLSMLIRIHSIGLLSSIHF